MRNIFVFGSNLSGLHGAGSAKEAFDNQGAKWGQGVGLHGNSYAIPTKDRNLEVLPLHRIKPFVDKFIYFAKSHPEMTFNIVAIGCGLAGYKPQQIAKMFKEFPSNCNLPKEFLEIKE